MAKKKNDNPLNAGTPFCVHCQSWHAKPKDQKHAEELKCFNPKWKKPVVEKTPTAEVVQRYMSRRADLLHDLRKAAAAANFAFENEMRQLKWMAENHPNIFDDDAKRTIQFLTEMESDIMELTLDGNEHPFFSEATLYPLLGKDAARSVLAAVEKLVTRARK